jgi:hypothetical protein
MYSSKARLSRLQASSIISMLFRDSGRPLPDSATSRSDSRRRSSYSCLVAHESPITAAVPCRYSQLSPYISLTESELVSNKLNQVTHTIPVVNFKDVTASLREFFDKVSDTPRQARQPATLEQPPRLIARRAVDSRKTLRMSLRLFFSRWLQNVRFLSPFATRSRGPKRFQSSLFRRDIGYCEIRAARLR